MLVEQYLLDGLCGSKKAQGFASQFGQVLEHGSMMDCFLDGCPPSERRVAGHQNGWTGQGIAFGKGLNDGSSGIGFVVGLDLAWAQQPGAGNVPVKVIGVGGSQRRQWLTCLCPSRGEQTVGMDNAADPG